MQPRTVCRSRDDTSIALPKNKRQTAEQAAAFAKQAVEQNELQRGQRAIREDDGVAFATRRQVLTGPPFLQTRDCEGPPASPGDRLSGLWARNFQQSKGV